MLYVKSLDVAVGKTQTSPATTTVKVWRGIIHSIEVFIPPGHNGLAKLQIYHGAHIIFPTNQDGYISGDKTTVKGKLYIDLKKKVNVIKLVGWNDDETYSHEFIVRIGVLPEDVLLPELKLIKAITELKGMFA